MDFSESPKKKNMRWSHRWSLRGRKPSLSLALVVGLYQSWFPCPVLLWESQYGQKIKPGYTKKEEINNNDEIQIDEDMDLKESNLKFLLFTNANLYFYQFQLSPIFPKKNKTILLMYFMYLYVL